MELPAGEKKTNERKFLDRSQFCGDGDLQLRVVGQNGTFTRAWACRRESITLAPR